jgi:hypothetical protein
MEARAIYKICKFTFLLKHEVLLLTPVFRFYLDTNGTAQNYTASFGDTNSTRYDHMAFCSSGTSWGSYVYLGGPGAVGAVDG